VTGNPETKELKDMLPDALKQLGPHQLNHIKNLLGAGGVDAVKESSK
jgi:penicillin-binding protein-related factor A (putative recombinase)